MTFGQALESAKAGSRIRLPHWNEDVSLVVQYPDEGSKMTHPYIYVESRFGRVPWNPTSVEIFSDDWEVVCCESCCSSEDNLVDNLSSSISILVDQMSEEFLKEVTSNALFGLLSAIITEDTESEVYQFASHLLDLVDSDNEIRTILPYIEMSISEQDSSDDDILDYFIRGFETAINEFVDAMKNL